MMRAWCKNIGINWEKIISFLILWENTLNTKKLQNKISHLQFNYNLKCEQSQIIRDTEKSKMKISNYNPWISREANKGG